jgi:hypothetical protein
VKDLTNDSYQIQPLFLRLKNPNRLPEKKKDVGIAIPTPPFFSGLYPYIKETPPVSEVKWLSLAYLADGTPMQQASYIALLASRIFEYLHEFQPVLTGTIPLAIDIPGSDLDILCEVYDFAPFAEKVKAHYGHLPDFYQNQKKLNGTPAHITRFTWELEERPSPWPMCEADAEPPRRFALEIVAQPVPVTEQRAYRHLCAEAHLLAQGGESARVAIRALKRSGMKTEPAFGLYFGLEGDLYEVLLRDEIYNFQLK